jgi:hypothetical protein
VSVVAGMSPATTYLLDESANLLYREPDVRRVLPARVAVPRRRVDDFRGLPPSFPFSRDDAAFRLDLTEPRHAGQKDTKSI